MTWMSTWPEQGIPQYATHPTETAAEAHAREIVKSKRSLVATAFWADNTTEAEENAA